MKHIEKFQKFKTNEDLDYRSFGKKLNRKVHDSDFGPAMILAGIYFGFSKIEDMFDFFAYKKAVNKIEPIFKKIDQDDVIKSLLEELLEYKPYLRREEVEGGRFDEEKYVRADDILVEIDQRAKELLSESEYNIFKSSYKEIDYQNRMPGSYFIDK
jgi:hypothetical protein